MLILMLLNVDIVEIEKSVGISLPNYVVDEFSAFFHIHFFYYTFKMSINNKC